MAPRLTPLNLADTDREQLERWARARDNRRPLALRARIVLCCHAGCSNRESARRLKLTPQTVGKWRALPRARCAGPRGPSPLGCPAHDQRRAGGGRARQDLARESARRCALEQPAPRRSARSLAAHDPSHLAHVRPVTEASTREGAIASTNL